MRGPRVGMAFAMASLAPWAANASPFPSLAVNRASNETCGMSTPPWPGAGDRKLWRHDRARTALRAVLRGLRARRRVQALAGQDHHRVRRPSLLHDHDESS